MILGRLDRRIQRMLKRKRGPDLKISEGGHVESALDLLKQVRSEAPRAKAAIAAGRE
jgi:hypothetical protein